jgi:iron complex transport system substrate-binding protein
LRIVSLAPSATAILLAIAARRNLVGVSKWCRHVADVSGLPQLGDCWQLDPAQVMKLRPNLVIGSVPFKAETVGKLLAEPVTFLAQNPRRLADIYSDIRLFGAITGRVRRAQQVIAHMQAALAQLRARAPRRTRRPRVYCEAWPNPRISSPPWVAELVEMVGGRLVATPGQRISDEQVAAARPEVIVLAWAATGAKSKPQTALRNPKWQAVPAVEQRRVFAIRDELLNTPAPILVQGARALLGAIHNR